MKSRIDWPDWANFVTSTPRQYVTFWQNEPTYVQEHDVWVDYMDGRTMKTRQKHFADRNDWIECRPINVRKPSFFERLIAIFGL